MNAIGSQTKKMVSLSHVQKPHQMLLPFCLSQYWSCSVSLGSCLGTHEANSHLSSDKEKPSEQWRIIGTALFRERVLTTGVIVYRWFLVWIPAEEEQRERFIVCRNQITCVAFHRVEQRILFPFSRAKVQAAEQCAYGVLFRSSQCVQLLPFLKGFLSILFLLAKNLRQGLDELFQCDGARIWIRWWFFGGALATDFFICRIVG